jgi:hypothetical protein
MSFKHFTGWLIIAANLVNAPIAALYLLWVVSDGIMLIRVEVWQPVVTR